jgi:predicted DNA-binding ribbon-helix-helix protein
LQRRSLTIAGHRTSLALEQEFWDGLEVMATATGKSLPALIRDIDEDRADANLSSAIRIAVVRWYRDEAARIG